MEDSTDTLPMRILELITELSDGPHTLILDGKSYRRIQDYRAEEEEYLELLHYLKNFTTKSDEGCYKCNLFDIRDPDTFVSKKSAEFICRQTFEWRNVSLHPLSLETFLGHFICIRCLASLLTSNDPISSMRAILRWDNVPSDDIQSTSSFKSARSEFSV